MLSKLISAPTGPNRGPTPVLVPALAAAAADARSLLSMADGAPIAAASDGTTPLSGFLGTGLAEYSATLKAAGYTDITDFERSARLGLERVFISNIASQQLLSD